MDNLCISFALGHRFGYVEFGSVEAAKAAVDTLNEVEFWGRNLRVDFAGQGGSGGGGRGGTFCLCCIPFLHLCRVDPSSLCVLLVNDCYPSCVFPSPGGRGGGFGGGRGGGRGGGFGGGRGGGFGGGRGGGFGGGRGGGRGGGFGGGRGGGRGGGFGGGRGGGRGGGFGGGRGGGRGGGFGGGRGGFGANSTPLGDGPKIRKTFD